MRFVSRPYFDRKTINVNGRFFIRNFRRSKEPRDRRRIFFSSRTPTKILCSRSTVQYSSVILWLYFYDFLVQNAFFFLQIVPDYIFTNRTFFEYFLLKGFKKIINIYVYISWLRLFFFPEVPGPVRSEPTVSDRANNRISLTWDRPEKAETILVYRVESRLESAGEECWKQVSENLRSVDFKTITYNMNWLCLIEFF